METIMASPIVAGTLGIHDCSGVADGAAALIVRAEHARDYTDRPMYVKALSLVAGPAQGPVDPSYDFTSFDEVVASAHDAYAQAGVENPRAEISLAEVHDCFTPTELVLMQIRDPTLGLTHNLGGQPGACVSFVSIVGAEPDV